LKFDRGAYPGIEGQLSDSQNLQRWLAHLLGAAAAVVEIARPPPLRARLASEQSKTHFVLRLMDEKRNKSLLLAGRLAGETPWADVLRYCPISTAPRLWLCPAAICQIAAQNLRGGLLC
jgi:hypothetical protein